MGMGNARVSPDEKSMLFAQLTGGDVFSSTVIDGTFHTYLKLRETVRAPITLANVVDMNDGRTYCFRDDAKVTLVSHPWEYPRNI